MKLGVENLAQIPGRFLEKMLGIKKHPGKTPEQIIIEKTAFNILPRLRKLAKSQGTEPFTFSECTKGLPKDEGNEDIRHRDVVMISKDDKKLYIISVYPKDPRKIQIADYGITKGITRTFVFEDNSLKEASMAIKTIKITKTKEPVTNIEIEEKSTMLVPNDFTAEKQILFLKEVSEAKVDIEATRKLQEKVLEEKTNAEAARKQEESSPFLRPLSVSSDNVAAQ